MSVLEAVMSIAACSDRFDNFLTNTMRYIFFHQREMFIFTRVAYQHMHGGTVSSGIKGHTTGRILPIDHNVLLLLIQTSLS